jgi:hypothetical protein
MTILAKGAEQVRRLEKAFRGGDPPADAIETSKSHILRYVSERSEARKAMHADMRRLTERRRKSLLAHVSMDDEGIKQEMQESRALFETRFKRRRAKPIREPRTKLEPCVMAGSLEWFRNPPYDGQYFSPPIQNQNDTSTTLVQAEADGTAGTYNVGLYSEGQGSQSCGAGIAVSIVAPPGLQSVQSFGAILNYGFVWADQANFFTADNDLTTNIWVWGNNENAWVGQGQINPSWGNHATWLASNGNEDDFGTGGGICQFIAQPGGSYVAWVWSNAYVEADGGQYVGALSTLQMGATVVYVSLSQVIELPWP